MLKVSEVMTRSPTTVTPMTSLREVLACMNTHGCRHVPVVEQGRLVGIVSDRDLRLAVDSPVVSHDDALERAEILEGLTAAICMTSDPMCVAPEQSAYEVAGLMRLHGFGAFPVVAEGELVGIISASDYLGWMAAQAEA